MRFESPNQSETLNEDNKFIGIDEFTTVDDIANLLDPTDTNEVFSILYVTNSLIASITKSL